MSFGLPIGLALASGVNTYMPLFALALFARFGQLVHVSPRFHWLISDEAIVILGVLVACEILAQKFPGLDNFWDFVHTLLRPVAGALAAGAVLSTDQMFEMVLVMLTGATLATAAHSAKAGLRLVSTSKSFGVANPFLSATEDVAVVLGTLLSVFAPWVMVIFAVLFAITCALAGPPLFRTLRFNLSMLAGWMRWAGEKVTRHSPPGDIKQTLLEANPRCLQSLSSKLEPGEELLGLLAGWKRSGWSPRRAWLMITPKKLVIAEPRFLRGFRTESKLHGSVSLVRDCESLLMVRLEYVTRENQSVKMFFPRSRAAFAALAAEKIRSLAGLAPGPIESESAKLAATAS